MGWFLLLVRVNQVDPNSGGVVMDYAVEASPEGWSPRILPCQPAKIPGFLLS